MNYKLSKWVVGLAAACAFAGQALAGNYSLPILSNGDGTFGANFGYFTDGTVSAGGGLLGSGNLSDIFTFTLTPGQAGTLSSLYATTAYATLPNLSLSLFDMTTQLSVAAANSYINDGNGTVYLTATPYLVARDIYALTVTDSTPGAVGAYNGNFIISPVSIASTVPEPSEGALLLSGLALIGLIAARRRRQQPAPTIPIKANTQIE